MLSVDLLVDIKRRHQAGTRRSGQTPRLTPPTQHPSYNCFSEYILRYVLYIAPSAPFGITYSLLIVSPVINDIAVMLLITLLVWQVAVLYVLAGMAFAYAGGMIMERFRADRWVEDYV
ncbi:MAG: permease [Gammaproteobacteria bacterium]|nr:permease [Gammaproteobacteria bacterium]